MSRAVSAVIPIFNMKEFVPPLWAGLKTSGALEHLEQVIFVDDGSTDGTAEALEQLLKSDRGASQSAKVHRLAQNQGRFHCRLAGARVAQSELVLFIDARVGLPANFGERLLAAKSQHRFVQPQCRIDVDRNVYCLYWELSHRRLFAFHYAAIAKGPVELTVKNYDAYLKGTTVLLAPRNLFITSCESFGAENVLSDDTLVMKKMVQTESLWLDPEFIVDWVPRESLKPFLWRLYDRGPGLIEYHVFTQRGWIFAAIVMAALGLIVWFGLVIYQPGLGLEILAGLGLGMLISAAYFARNFSEWLRIAPLHVLVLVAIGLGVLKGLAVNIRRWMKGELKFTQSL